MKVFWPGVERRGADGDRARNQQRQLVVVAGLQRQVGDGVGLHHGADLGGLGLQHRHGIGNFHLLRDRAEREREIDPRRLVQFEWEGGAQGGLESGCLHLHLVTADGEAREVVHAAFIGLGGPHGAAVHIAGDDVRAHDGGAGGVGDLPGDSAACLLGEQRG